jgi:hypothetical protein
MKPFTGLSTLPKTKIKDFGNTYLGKEPKGEKNTIVWFSAAVFLTEYLFMTGRL